MSAKPMLWDPEISRKKLALAHPWGVSCLKIEDSDAMKRSMSNRLQGFKPRGELIKTINADASVDETVYDSIGRRSSLIQTVAGLAKTVNFVYDAANRLLSRSPEGLAVESRSFTNRGQLASVGAPGTAGVPPALVAGRETSRTYGNGLNTTSSYSRADNLLTSLGARQPSGVPVPELSFNYSYDSNKNVTAEQRGGSMALYSWNATFDATGRLNSQSDGAQTRSW